MAVEGFLAADPDIREASGKRVANFSIPHQARRLNKQTNSWEDVGDTLWVRVALWEADAELAAEHLRKGSLVRVEGEPELKAWERDGKSGVTLNIKFAKWSIIPRKPRQSQQQAPDDTPWPSNPPAQSQGSGQGQFPDDSENPF